MRWATLHPGQSMAPLLPHFWHLLGSENFAVAAAKGMFDGLLLFGSGRTSRWDGNGKMLLLVFGAELQQHTNIPLSILPLGFTIMNSTHFSPPHISTLNLNIIHIPPFALCYTTTFFSLINFDYSHKNDLVMMRYMV